MASDNIKDSAGAEDKSKAKPQEGDLNSHPFNTVRLEASTQLADQALAAHQRDVQAKAAESEKGYTGLAAAGLAAVTIGGLAIATRGRSLLTSEGAIESVAARTAIDHLPGLIVSGGKSAAEVVGGRAGAEAVAGRAGAEVAAGKAGAEVAAGKAGGDVAARTAGGDTGATASMLREQTLAEKVSEKAFHFSVSTAQKVLEIMGKAEKTEAVTVSDDVRRSVFNRFLSRLDQDRYVLHGSYQLESQQFIARKATKDLDILAVDSGLMKPTKAETNAAILEDFQRMLSRDKKDGLTFDVAFVDKEPIHYFFPRMRHGVAVAKSEGQELMRIPLDVRLGAKTLLPPQKQVLPLGEGALGRGGESTVISAMEPGETLAYKLFSYTNRTIGGVKRKAKDLTDMADMLKKGVDETQVVRALEEWTSRGYTLGPMRHPEEIMGTSRLLAKPELMMGRNRDQLDDAFRTVRNYYDQVAPKVANTPLRPEVSNGVFSRMGRFFSKQNVVYPKE